jgi:uncharacterized protein YfaS (alpha-2-macroglobulin family)
MTTSEASGTPGGMPPTRRPGVFRVVIRCVVIALCAVSTVLGKVFGSLRWTPPGWSGPVVHATRRLASGVSGFSRRHRRPLTIATAGFGVLLLAAGALAIWLASRPRPLEIAVSVEAPGLTAIEPEPHPNPLRIRFDRSAARLERIGKPLSQGVRLDPSLPGEWKFEDDRTLVFRPAQDWAVGQKYRVTLGRTLLPEHVRLATYEVKFASAPFTASITHAEFYQDPTNPLVKRVVARVAFSHPVDAGDLAKRLALRMRGEKGGLLGLGAKSHPLTVSYDKLKGEAYVRSEPIPIPPENAWMSVTVEAGARAARGGPPTASPVSSEVQIPGMYSYFRLSQARLALVPNERFEPEQVLVIETTAGATEDELGKAVAAWVLPKDRPALSAPMAQEAVKDYRWSADEIGPEILALSTQVALAPIPADRADAALHSFKVQVPVGRFLYVRVAKGTRSFGGYVLAQEASTVVAVPAFPKELKIAQPGALLSLAGDKKISILARDIEGIRFEVARILPGEVTHLVTQSQGTFAEPEFEWRFGPDDLTERFEEKRTLQQLAPGKAQYAAFDLAPYLGEGSSRHGLFLFKAESWDPTLQKATGVHDQRLLLVTDLGLVVKQGADKGHDVFVQNIHAGTPASGVAIQVLGRNGLPVVSATTDADGHARLPRLDDFQREKAPVAFLARRGDDVSFIPYQRRDRQLELSRFDVGGVVTGGRGARLDAYLFSDRGLYRPGDLFHVAAIVKAPNWKAPLAGVPLETVITDPRGLEVLKERIALPASGFTELSYKTEESSPTGQWATSLYLVEANGQRGALVGSTQVRVAEFQPDRLRISARLSTERAEGWVSPKDLTGRVSLQNLFGTPAESRLVVAELTLAPARPAFRAWKDYVFSDPLAAKHTFTDRLQEANTDGKGEASFALNLERFERATYRLTFTAEGHEAEGGRGVTGAATVLVSPMPYLIGYKPDGDLRYVSRGTERAVELVAVGPNLTGMEVKGLEAELIELRWLSVLSKQRDDVYRYESVRRELPRSKKPLALAAQGTRYALPTGDPGDFVVLVRNAERTELARIPFSVAGSGNVARALEKNAELQVKLARSDYAPGDKIELQITAPYTGAGLITIERDRVYAWKWFHASTTNTVQTITVPADLEGNGYVSVAFVRGFDSQEIFTSPLSHGVAPFSVSRLRRTNDVELSAPEVARPGQLFKIRYHAQKVGKAVLFAVDEGILQVARFDTPDPLGHFFKKRALEVRTDQILDLILPEFAVVQSLSAAGGDDGASALAKNLNPFKRKRDKPAVYWSGIVDVDETDRELTWTVPEAFSGTLRVMAVAVSPDAVGSGVRKALVRGPFVLNPNAPTFVAPGDMVDVSVGVANNVEASGKAARIKLELAASEQLEVQDGAERTLEIGEGREASASFKVKAKGALGSATLRFTASLGDKRSARSVDLSVRPAAPFETVVLTGRLAPGKREEPAISRKMFSEYRTLEVSASPLPVGLSRGLIRYLERFPHGCTEQLVSQAFPAIVLRNRTEFGYAPGKVEENLKQVLAMLRSRQNTEGAFGMWAGNGRVSDFQTIYALHFLTEAKERGYPVPQDFLARGLTYARGVAVGQAGVLGDPRLRAYALYVLTRNGVVTTRELASLREALEGQKDRGWRTDLTSVYLAACHALLKQDAQADRLIGAARLGEPQHADYARFYDGLVYDAQLLYILARHFPGRLSGLPPEGLEGIARRIAAGEFNTLSSAYAILAFDAYAQAAGTAAQRVEATVAELLGDGKARPLALPAGLFPRAVFSPQARSLRVTSAGDLPIFWQATLAGFDLAAPTAEIKDKLEIFRELRARDGKATTRFRLGDELEIHLRIRSLGGWQANVAIVDLLPGGFEPVLESRITPLPEPPATRAEPGETGSTDGEGEREGDAYDQANTASALPIGTEASTWRPEYADVREDRVVLYGTVGTEAREFVYRVKATNRGTFVAPPPFAESMYDRTVKARGLAARVQVSGGDD